MGIRIFNLNRHLDFGDVDDAILGRPADLLEDEESDTNTDTDTVTNTDTDSTAPLTILIPEPPILSFSFAIKPRLLPSDIAACADVVIGFANT